MEINPPLPPVSEAVADAVAGWLQSHEGMQRRPVGTAKVPVLAVLLNREKRPWPIRREVADHLGVSQPLVDMVVSQRSASGHFELLVKSRRGFVERRSAIRERFIVPSQAVIEAVEKAAPAP